MIIPNETSFPESQANNIISVKWDLEYLKRKMADQSQFADEPDLYHPKHTFFAWADLSLMGYIARPETFCT
jgi:hypothetical protein